jgi:flagellin-like protein
MMKKMWKMRKDKSAVSPVIATILMVAITVVLAAVLYVMVMGFGGSGSNNTPTASFSRNLTGTATVGTATNADIYQFTVASVSTTSLALSSVQVIITPVSATALNGPFVTQYTTFPTTGYGTVQGVGAVAPVGTSGATAALTYLGAGDYFNVNGCVSGTSYTVTVKDTATGGSIYSVSFVAA